MRDKLAPHLQEFVLCKGWIEDWKPVDENTTRVYIKNPIIKEANKNVLFDDLKLISKEHHINLFLDKEHSKDLRRLESIYFNGVINKYTRSNGTYDYGINPEPFSSLHTEIDALFDDMEVNFKKKPKDLITRGTLITYEFRHSARLDMVEEKVEKAGDKLPTFYNTYDQYKEMIQDLKNELKDRISFIRHICSNRKLRRQFGVEYNFALAVPTYESVQEIQKEILQ